MYLTGGTPFSGTTLLTILLTQGSSVCLDEPDFHKPEQRHRGIPQLQERCPDAVLPPAPESALTVEETLDFTAACEAAIAPRKLGWKTCGGDFVRFARAFRARGHPVVGMVRDIRDVLARPLPPWLDEEKVNREFLMVWRNLSVCDVWCRYEDLVRDTQGVLDRISAVLGQPLTAPSSWDGAELSGHLLKINRHEALKTGRVVADRIGIWRTSGRPLAESTARTAALMGY